MERRKYKRLPIDLHLEVDEVFKQDYVVIRDLNADVEVFDISKTGIGFLSEASLPLGYYFRTRINLGDGEFFHAVIQIVRAHISENDRKIYGATFVGLAPFLADKIDHYEIKLKESEAGEHTTGENTAKHDNKQ
ncbi:MAG TPA: PilZ domain-containing protein [Clostridiales bacterium]|nr:PilZ domain-containing protein [Clostridiales bacterium]